MPKRLQVTVAKPKKGGAVFRAPLGTPLPTSAAEALNEAFASLGYISTDGVTNTNSPEIENVKAWGGDIVYTHKKEKADTFKMTLIEALNAEVLKAVYGDSNVTGTLETGLAVTANNDEQDENALVIDTILRGGVLKRVVIPSAAVTAVAVGAWLLEYSLASAQLPWALHVLLTPTTLSSSVLTPLRSTSTSL